MAVNVRLCKLDTYQGVEILVSLFQNAQQHISEDHDFHFLCT